jgi:hypothetical protein
MKWIAVGAAADGEGKMFEHQGAAFVTFHHYQHQGIARG